MEPGSKDKPMASARQAAREGLSKERIRTLLSNARSDIDVERLLEEGRAWRKIRDIILGTPWTNLGNKLHELTNKKKRRTFNVQEDK